MGFWKKLGENHTLCHGKVYTTYIKSAFVYSCAYIIVNVETELKMVYYKQQSGSRLR